MSPAKAVPVSMADGESAEPLLEGSAMSEEHSMSGQEQAEREGGDSRAPNVDLQAGSLPNHCLMGQATDQTV